MGVKMSDVFSLPTKATDGSEHRHSGLFKGFPLLYSNGNGKLSRGIVGSVCFAELPDTGTSPRLDAVKAAEYTSTAINAYDSNQSLIASQAETIAKQQEQVELLREALKEISLDKIDTSSRVMGIAIFALEGVKALAATGGGE